MRSPAARSIVLQRWLSGTLLVGLALAGCDSSAVQYPAESCAPVGEFGTEGCARIEGAVRVLPADRPLSGIRVSATPSPDRRTFVSNGISPTLSKAGDYSLTIVRWSLDSLGGPDTMTARVYWYGYDDTALFGMDSADVLVRFVPEGQVPVPSRLDVSVGP